MALAPLSLLLSEELFPKPGGLARGAFPSTNKELGVDNEVGCILGRSCVWLALLDYGFMCGGLGLISYKSLSINSKLEACVLIVHLGICFFESSLLFLLGITIWDVMCRLKDTF